MVKIAYLVMDGGILTRRYSLGFVIIMEEKCSNFRWRVVEIDNSFTFPILLKFSNFVN